MSDESDGSQLLSQLHLASFYERKARLAPAVLAVLFGVPGALVWGLEATNWIASLLGGAGIGIVVAIGLSHLASAMGNAYQERLWPRWPYDSPTNLRLKPGNEVVSEQQRLQWCNALHRMTGLELCSETTDEDELERTIKDAVAAGRAMLWELPDKSRLSVHNADYGFARNFAGMRAIWIVLAAGSAIACWIALFLEKTSYFWPVASTLLLILAIYLAIFRLSHYVRRRADYYAESFFSAIVDAVKESG